MNILAVDAGNSRIKWGLFRDGAWVERNWTSTRQPELAAQWANLPEPDILIAANVAGPAAEAAIAAATPHWPVAIRWIRSQPAQCGVTSGYSRPGQLGCDRWAALIGARALHPGQDLLVVHAGTAVTIDSLTADGRFLGGLILPGRDAMLEALARRAAGLARQQGRWAAFPDNTGDAMASGAAEAVAGAIARSYQRLADIAAHAPLCLLGGGDGDMLQPLLKIPTERTENLVLEGLLAIAIEQGKT